MTDIPNLETNPKTRRGRPSVSPAELERRSAEYVKLKALLGLSAPAIARILGMHPTYVHRFPKSAPTQQTLNFLRAEALRRARAHVDEVVGSEKQRKSDSARRAKAAIKEAKERLQTLEKTDGST